MQDGCASGQIFDLELRKRAVNTTVNMPQRMTKEHQGILNHFRSSIADALELEPTLTTVIDILIEKGILSDKDCDTVEAEKIKYKKARQLIAIIKGKHDDAFFIFKEALQKASGFFVIPDLTGPELN